MFYFQPLSRISMHIALTHTKPLSICSRSLIFFTNRIAISDLPYHFPAKSRSQLYPFGYSNCFGSKKSYSYSTENGSRYSRKWQRLQQNPIINYLRSFRWTPIPLGVGFALIAYQQYCHIRQREKQRIADTTEDYLAKQWEVNCYRILPLKTFSRIWGWVNNMDLPIWARYPLLSFYARTFGCNMKEAEHEDFRHYRNLGEFFRRPLKAAARFIQPGDCLVSPADGMVLYFGRVEHCCLEQVKGVKYSLDTFLGHNSWSGSPKISQLKGTHYQQQLLSNPQDNVLYHCVVYLAPGDYHRFHSPVNWEISFRRHFTGELLSVNPGVAKWIAGLFNLNERVVYIGKWRHGFFSMAAVGATNVGSIKVHIDKDLRTNVRLKKDIYLDYSFQDAQGKGVKITKGELFGEFNLGSTIVLIFEAPNSFQFNLKAGQRIKYGEALNVCCDMEAKSTTFNSISNIDNLVLQAKVQR